MNDPMAFLNFDELEYKRNEAERAKRPNRHDLDRRICACGHPMARHKPNKFVQNIKDAHTCRLPSVGSICTCKLPKPALQVHNTKRFLRTAIKDGGPSGHPLIRGIQAVKEASEEEYMNIEWLIPIKCDRCDTEDVRVTPVGFFIELERFDENNGAGDLTFFLCDDCRFPATSTSENDVISSEDQN